MRARVEKSQEKGTPMGAIVISVLFFLGLSIQFLRFDLPKAPLENRVKAPFPKLGISWDCALHCMPEFELWFSDHFSPRNLLLKWNSILRNQILKSSTSDSVFFGKDGWFYPSFNGSKEDVRRMLPFSEGELRELSGLLAARRTWMNRKKLPYLMVIAPDAESIYPEHLPDSLSHSVGLLTRQDQLLFLSKKEGLPILDLRGHLKRAKAFSPASLYPKTDAHWTDVGAFFAYQKIIFDLRKELSTSPPAELEDFELKFEEDPEKGDLVLLLGLSGSVREKFPVLAPKNGHKFQRMGIAKDYTSETSPAPNRLRGLVFHDSFFRALQPFFSSQFKSVRYLTAPISTQTMNSLKPDFVIEEFAERRISIETFKSGAVELDLENFLDAN